MKNELYFVGSDNEYASHIQQLIQKEWPTSRVRCFNHIKTLYRKLVLSSTSPAGSSLPHLVICNPQMKGLDGLHLLNLLKQNIDGRPTVLANIPVVIFTDGISPEEEERCYSAGAALVLKKPTRYNDLKASLNRMINEYVSRSSTEY
jgi:CheY-like chemotaxis protein